MKRNKVEDSVADRKAMRRAGYEERKAAMADGRFERAHTFEDKRREERRKACRGRIGWE